MLQQVQHQAPFSSFSYMELREKDPDFRQDLHIGNMIR